MADATLRLTGVSKTYGSGATAVEAYPVALAPGETIPATAVYTGTLSMFERAGFRVVADRASDPSSRHPRVVVRLELAPG